MNFDEYQKEARKTAIYDTITDRVTYPALGLSGEAGEVANKVKKMLRDKNLDVAGIAKEIGDVLWYCANLAEDLGFSLQGIAEENLSKLKRRQEEGKLGGSGDNR